MASKRKSKAAPPPVERDYIAQTKLVSLLRKCSSASEQMGELNGALREKIAYAVENDGLHKSAFSIVRRYFKKEPEQIGAFWDHLRRYWADSGLEARGDSAPGLELEPTEEKAPRASRPRLVEAPAPEAEVG